MAGSSLTWDLIVNSDKFGSGMAKANAATAHLQKTMEGAKKESLLMSKAAGLVAGVGIAAALKSAVSAASDYNETASKAQVVFKQNSKAVMDWAKTSATAMGMSQQQATEAAATFGNLFTALKIGQKPAADMSMKLVGLASDLASFNNVDPAEALDALRSGLVGETEPLRKFGVNMNDATLQAEAMKLGLINHKVQALDPAIKAQAAYALILEQTKTAQGDFGRTSDGLANSTRIFSAEIEDAKKNLGQALLPVVTQGTHGLNALLGVFNELPGPIQSTATVAAILAAGFAIMLPRIVATKAAAAEMGLTWEKTRGVLGKAATAMIALAAAGALMKQFGDQSVNAGAGVNELGQALERTAKSGKIDDKLGFTSAALGAQSFTDALDLAANANIGDKFAEWAGGVTTLGSSLDDAKQSVSGVDAALAQLVTGGKSADAAAAFAAISKAWVASGHDASQLTALLPQYRDAMAGATGATAGMADAQGNLTPKVVDNRTEIQKLTDSIDKLRGTQMSADEATAAMRAAIDAATASIKTNGKTLDDHTAKGRANKSALQDIARTALDGVDSWVKNGDSVKQVTAKTTEARNAFVKSAEQMGLSKKAAEHLADAYGLIPGKVSTRVTNNIGTAQQQLDTLLSTLNKLRGKVQIDVRAGTQGTGGGRTLKGNAAGGLITGPGSGTSDSIPRMLSNGEFVMTAAAVNKYGTGFMAAINSGAFSPVAAGGGSGAGGGTTVVAPVNLYLDGNVVATSLLRVKRSRGGQPLGIA